VRKETVVVMLSLGVMAKAYGASFLITEYQTDSRAVEFGSRLIDYLKSLGYEVITLSSRGSLPSVRISKMTFLEDLETYGVKKVCYHPSSAWVPTTTRFSTLSYILDDVEYYVTLRDLLINA